MLGTEVMGGENHVDFRVPRDPDQASNQENEADFAKLIMSYDSYIRSVVIRKFPHLRDAGLIDDVVSETYLSALKSRDRIDTTGNIKNFLTTIAVNKAIDIIRKRGRHDKTITSQNYEAHYDKAASGEDMEAKLIGSEDRRLAEELLKELPYKYREPLLLDMEGLSNQEIADKLGLTVQAVKTRLHRAKDKLRQIKNELEQN